MAILTKIRDPRVRDVTVTYVEVSGDLRQAKVHVSVMGDEKKQELCMHGLRSSTGFLQQKVSERVDTRYTPRLKFVLDSGVKKSVEVSRILGELLPEESHDEPDDETTLDVPSPQGEPNPRDSELVCEDSVDTVDLSDAADEQ